MSVRWPSSVQTCAVHGDYAGSANRCPVCEGRSTGRTNTVHEDHVTRRRFADVPANEDDGLNGPRFAYAPEIDRAWRGEL